MFSFSREIAVGTPKNPCAKVCGTDLGGAELVLLRQVLGLCLRLSLRLSADCRSGEGG
ncbi:MULTISPECIES: hypothetical protein [Streptomyces]|uniref:hypothetical protein n=1 Tax=Streptomyces TaxID=1883 RepID=UPI00140A314D|nr:MULTISPECIES: hypothetical protein [Streptomyces]MDH6223953.1 hypothetical protein [Streptomyces sp. MJP52]